MMKTCKHLFEKIYDIDNLRVAHRKARKGKSGRPYVKEFEKDIENNLLCISKDLARGYEPQPLHKFIIRDPKTRVIQAPAFRDRVVHHAICNILEPIFDKTFVFDSYASRRRKGTHSAIRRFDKFKRKVSSNGTLLPYARDNNMTIGWSLKADIRHYFPSVNHDILLTLLKRKIRDADTLWLLQKIIHEYGSDGKGMPLGALTSQLFANVYLNPFDHFLKEEMQVKFYLRYVDDFVVLHYSQQELENILSEMNSFLSEKLLLELHPEKTSIFPLHNGVKLLGFRCFYHYKLLRKSNMRYFLNNLADMEDRNRAQKSLEGWLAHAKHANTYKLRNKVVAKYGAGSATF
jgi:retron-type reverse transcriptase